jgi:hypothetical protein
LILNAFLCTSSAFLPVITTWVLHNASLPDKAVQSAKIAIETLFIVRVKMESAGFSGGEPSS